VGNSASQGGGVWGSAANECMFITNSASQGGAGYFATLNNCTLVGNLASDFGGGATSTSLTNCVLYYNDAPSGTNYDSTVAMSFCCTTPQPTSGIGNITNEPLFVDSVNGNLRLESNSPCINSGNNAFTPAGPDLDGNPRIVGGTVDIGAYEFQRPTSVISYAWLQQYGFTTDGSADYTDPDGDGMNNWQEWVAGTNPTNALSVLKMLAPSNNLSGVSVSWDSVGGITYFPQRSTNLAAEPSFSTVQTNLVGQDNTTTFNDTNAIGFSPFFYRVGVQH